MTFLQGQDMTLEPLLSAATPIQLHVATVVPGFFLGTWQIFFSRKGSPWHRALGWTYLALISLTAVFALFIRAQVGPTFLGFGLIHLFVVLVGFSTYNASQGARHHGIRRHRGAMIGLYVGGLLIAGGRTFLPGRIMHETFFGG